MLFASQVTKDIVRGEDTITIRKLSGKSLQKAREGRSMDQTSYLRHLGAELFRVLRSEALDEAAKKLEAMKEAKTPEERRKARYGEYDRDLVLNAGILRWSCGDLTPDRVADLPEEDAQALHEAILDLSLPPLDASEADAVPKGA